VNPSGKDLVWNDHRWCRSPRDVKPSECGVGMCKNVGRHNRGRSWMKDTKDVKQQGDRNDLSR
jgi:hypothetical protein